MSCFRVQSEEPPGFFAEEGPVFESTSVGPGAPALMEMVTEESDDFSMGAGFEIFELRAGKLLAQCFGLLLAGLGQFGFWRLGFAMPAEQRQTLMPTMISAHSSSRPCHSSVRSRTAAESFVLPALLDTSR